MGTEAMSSVPIDNVYLGDMRLKHINLTVDSLLSNGEVAAQCLSE